MYKIIPWHEDLNLEEFYTQAKNRRFINNASQQMLVDCFSQEKEKQIWILYYNDVAVGSVAVHSFDDVMGANTYRIAARTCVFSDMLPIRSLRTRNEIITHQHVTAQFLIPACLEWVPANSRVFITSNNTSVGTQKLVHKIFAPAMAKTGQMKKIKETFYRGTNQTVWELFPDKFYQQLNKYPKW